VTKFRQNLAVPVAAGVALIGSSAVALQRWWLLPVMAIPLAVLWWGVRSGVDADSERVTIRGLVGSRTVLWQDVAGLRVDGRRVFLTLSEGGEIPLPAVAAADVPRLVAAAGQTLGQDAPG
jgi:hypothetical protein